MARRPQGGRGRADLLRPARGVRRRRRRQPRHGGRDHRGAGLGLLRDGGLHRRRRLLRRPHRGARHAGAEGALAAAAVLADRPGRGRARHHRAERRLGRRGDDDVGREGRRRLRAERPEDVDLVRADGRPVHRVRADGAGIAVARHHRVPAAARRRGLRDRQEDPEDGRPLLPGGGAVLPRLLRGGRPARRRRGPGLLRPDAVVRRLARDARRERRRHRPRGARVRRRVRQGARAVRQEDPRVPGRLVPARRREDEARPGADADVPRGPSGRRGQAVRDRGGAGQAGRVGGGVVRHLGGRR